MDVARNTENSFSLSKQQQYDSKSLAGVSDNISEHYSRAKKFAANYNYQKAANLLNRRQSFQKLSSVHGAGCQSALINPDKAQSPNTVSQFCDRDNESLKKHAFGGGKRLTTVYDDKSHVESQTSNSYASHKPSQLVKFKTSHNDNSLIVCGTSNSPDISHAYYANQSGVYVNDQTPVKR